MGLYGENVMKTVIVYYSQHHGNTKKIVDAIALQFEVTVINVTEINSADLTNYDCIGFASGIYFSSFAKPVLTFAEKYLPLNKNVFFINTCGFLSPVMYFNAIRKIAKEKKCRELGAYQCLGYDTFGPFKAIGGIAKNHPNKKEIASAVSFYREIREKLDREANLVL